MSAAAPMGDREGASDDGPVTPARPVVPERPALTSTVRSPLEEFNQPRPHLIVVSVILWLLSCVAGLAIVIYLGSRISDVRLELRDTLIAEGRYTETAVGPVVDRTVVAALALIALPVALKLWFALLMGGRRNWARILLAIVGVLAFPLTFGAMNLLTGDLFDNPAWVVIAMFAQEVLVLAGLVTMFTRAPTTWFKTRLWLQ